MQTCIQIFRRNVYNKLLFTKFDWGLWALCAMAGACFTALGSVSSEYLMKTQGEIEAAICAGVNRIEQDYLGRGPKQIQAHLIGDLLIVRLRGVLTISEQQLVKTTPSEKGRDLLKQVRTQLMETARPMFEALVFETTGVNMFSLHHDICTITGDEIVIFTLQESPLFREIKKK
jgi:uncharacterized protein YbcI